MTSRIIKPLSSLFAEFFDSEKSGGLILIGCTILSLILANSGLSHSYTSLWHHYIDASFAGIRLHMSAAHWINDGLMTVFFLLVGLEIERELYNGELASFKNALLPILAAAGGMMVPAGIHYLFNAGGPGQAGIGIPMATDIAFALGVLSLLGKRVPAGIKVFLTALAIIDDLGAIIIIALFYTAEFSFAYFLGAMGIFIILLVFNKSGIKNLWFYLLPGVIMWYCMLQSGVHATITGVLLAFAIPFKRKNSAGPSYRLQHFLHKPVAFFILPLFALANTGLALDYDSLLSLKTSNSIGIMAGLIVGKPLGIVGLSYLAYKLRVASLPVDMNWKMTAGSGILAGIGFTMSVFITNLAFADQEFVEASKIAILVSSLVAGCTGYILLQKALPPKADSNI